LTGREWRDVESVGDELACVAVRDAGDQRQRAVGDLDDLLERVDAGSRAGGRHGSDVGEGAPPAARRRQVRA
jgi:hypothetical protein